MLFVSPYSLVLFPELFACDKPNENQDYCDYEQDVNQCTYAGQCEETN